MRPSTTLAAALAASVAIGASTSHAAIVNYDFNLQVDGNSISTGKFAGVSAGETLSIRYIVDAAVAPTIQGATRADWIYGSGSAGSFIQEVQISGSALDHTIPGAALQSAQANVLDDWAGSPPFVFDQFFLRGDAGLFDPDLRLVDVVLSSNSISPVIPITSLIGTGLPTQDSELQLSSFNSATFTIQGPGNIGSLYGTITTAHVPAPTTLACFAPAAFVAARRRR